MGLSRCYMVEKLLPRSSRNIEYGGMTLRRRNQEASLTYCHSWRNGLKQVSKTSS